MISDDAVVVAIGELYLFCPHNVHTDTRGSCGTADNYVVCRAWSIQMTSRSTEAN